MIDHGRVPIVYRAVGHTNRSWQFPQRASDFPILNPSRSRTNRLWRSVWRIIASAILVVIFGLAGMVQAADDPEIHVATSAEEIFVGESVDFQVEIRNSKNPAPPDMSPVKQDFDVVPKGDQSRNQSSTFIINGRVTQENVFSHIYLFQLTPKKSGSLTIPAVKAMVDGKTLTSDEIELRVIEPEKQDLVIAEIESSHPKVYPTQPFTITLRILVHPLPKDGSRDPLAPLRTRPPHIQMNWVDTPAGLSAEEKTKWLQPLLADDGIGFTLNDLNTRSGSFFDSPRAAAFKFSQRRETRDGLDGDQIRYFVYELSRTFTGEKTGSYTFGPAVVKGLFVSGYDRSEYQGKRLVTIAPAVTVDIREVPSPRPAGYCGAIGEYKVTASASPTNLRVGDPLTLTLELQRGSSSGSLELVSAPDLSAIPQLTDDFDLIDKNPTGRVEGAVKKFSYAMRPKRPNVSIPPLTVSTFDPQSEQFQDVTTAAIPLVVSEAQTLTAGELVGGHSIAPPSAIKSRSQGIFQNVTDVGELTNQHVSPISWAIASLAVWAVAGCLMLIVSLVRRRSSDPAWLRRQQARRTANHRLAEARTLLSQGKSVEALRLVRQSIIGWVADTRNKIAEGLTATDVDQILAQSNVPNEDRSELSRLLSAIESAEYGGSQSEDVGPIVDQVSKLIQRIAPCLERMRTSGT